MIKAEVFSTSQATAVTIQDNGHYMKSRDHDWALLIAQQ